MSAQTEQMLATAPRRSDAEIKPNKICVSVLSLVQNTDHKTH